MYKILRYLLAIALLFSVNDAFCQKSKSKGKKPDNRKSTTKEVQVFGEENEDYFNDKGVTDFNILKINPLVAAIGDFPIYYERVINSHFSMEFNLGPTLRPRYAWILNDPFNDNYVSVDFTNIEPKIGFLAGADLKYFPSRDDDAPEGFYMSLGARYRRYNARSFGYDEIGVPATAGNTVSTPVTMVDFARVCAGWGTLNDNFFSDFFFGFAMRNKTVSYTEPLVDPNTGLVYTNTRKDSKLVPALLAGIKIGFSF